MVVLTVLHGLRETTFFLREYDVFARSIPEVLG